jgi:hypothetical protein
MPARGHIGDAPASRVIDRKPRIYGAVVRPAEAEASCSRVSSGGIRTNPSPGPGKFRRRNTQRRRHPAKASPLVNAVRQKPLFICTSAWRPMDALRSGRDGPSGTWTGLIPYPRSVACCPTGPTSAYARKIHGADQPAGQGSDQHCRRRVIGFAKSTAPGLRRSELRRREQPGYPGQPAPRHQVETVLWTKSKVDRNVAPAASASSIFKTERPVISSQRGLAPPRAPSCAQRSLG